MMQVKVMPLDRHGYDFIPAEYLPQGAVHPQNEYWLRDAQQTEILAKKQKDCTVQNYWRKIKPDEILILEKNRNYCSNWDNFLVRDPFEPSLIRDSNFYGLVRIGTLNKVALKHHDYYMPAGILNSTIISCDIGDDTGIQDCAYISHYIIGDNCILSNVDEMQCTNHAKFGNGVIKDGEDEEVRIWIDTMNEAGGRSILPFADMIPADAYLWAAYRDDTALTEKLAEITQKQYGGMRGNYGVVGNASIIKSCSIIKDAFIGDCAYIKGANKLKNITINSSELEPTQIGEGVELVNGIIGYGCNIFYGCKAVRFVMGRKSNLKYGARLIHSVLGDNSTVSCCEILNSLIFPMHEQHHNTSFLIASLIQGISNMAAAATIGSNHNSRANDGEIRAGRGFWPGLAVSLKHSSVFASYTIIANGKYTSELNIHLPFSLVNNNIDKNRLEVMPAYFWNYNLYALERNSWKVQTRDKRKIKIQKIETDYLAPDTAEEIITALSLLDGWLGEAGYSPMDMDAMEAGPVRLIHCRHLEHSKRQQVIIKPLEAIAAYRQMLRYYAVKTIVEFFDSKKDLNFSQLCEILNSNPQQERVKDWVNIGGQIVPAFRVDQLRKEIGNGKYKTWDEIHSVYNNWDEVYAMDKCTHAWAVLTYLLDGQPPCNADAFNKELDVIIFTRRWIEKQIYESRAKDYRNPFKKGTFRGKEEMEQVLGKPAENPFIQLVQQKSGEFIEMIESVRQRIGA